MRGDGRVRKFSGSPYWHMVYSIDGREVAESTGELEEERAKRKLRAKLAELRAGDAVPHEGRVTLADLFTLLEGDYKSNGNRSLRSARSSWKHLEGYFGPGRKAISIATDRLVKYVAERQAKGAARATINIELALLGRALRLAVDGKLLGKGRLPRLPRLKADASRVRQGFLSRENMEAVAAQLDGDLADVVRFLFFSAWRVGEVRTLEWRDYDRAEGTIRLRPEHSKNAQGRVLPVVADVAAVIERRMQKRRLDCPQIFHRDGQRIGDFRKAWHTACDAAGLAGRIVHDLRRSGVRHLINAGNDLHVVMQFSGHKTDSMLKRYHVINVDDLRQAALRGAAYSGQSASIVPMRAAAENPERTR